MGQEEGNGNVPLHALYLVGDAGDFDDETNQENYLLEGLKKTLAAESIPSSLTFLGNQNFPKGLAVENAPDRPSDEAVLLAQMDLAKAFDGQTYFVPGNLDWNRGREGGLKAVRRQEQFIEHHWEDFERIHYYPSKGCADPKVKKINKDLVFVFMDTHWWLHNWDLEPDMNHGCDVQSRADLIRTLEETFVDYKNDQIVLMMHHPLRSEGNRGGHFSFSQHLFPLREVNKHLWLPIPILGSTYPLSRKIQGTKQDISNPTNERMMEAIVSVAKKHGVQIIFASGHEHNLQYFDEGKLKYVVSGSGAKTSFVRKGGDAVFTESTRGFAKITFYPNLESWIEYFEVSPEQEVRSIFKTKMYAPMSGMEQSNQSEYPSVTLRDTTVAADPNKEAGKWKRFWMGDQYRDLWTTPVSFRVLDLERENGGLEALKQGGGMSSNSLRLEASNEKQYVLRSVNKVFTRGLPEQFKNNRLVNVLKDQNSAYHPYGSWVVARLAEAADVYCTKPDFVFLKRQKELKGFNPYFPENIYLFEQRPAGDWSGETLFGGSKKIISYADLWTKLLPKKHHFVDQEWALKSRLFDLFIHDWDRHDDQWRWASFKEDGNTYWRPIPRDRDLAFYKFKGVIPSFISSVVIAKYKTMGDNVKDVKNLSFNGKYFDRSYLTELDWEEWKEVTKTLQTKLTDEVIEESSRDLPPEIRGISDRELNDKLKNRRDNLMEISERFYKLISKEVEIPGTDRKDHFKIQYQANGNVLVEHYITSKKEGDILKYDRLFTPDATKVIRLYGLRGVDYFEIEGTYKSPIELVIIGGEEQDVVEKRTPMNKIKVYDEKDGMTISGAGIKDKRSNRLGVNDWDRLGFTYDVPLFKPKFHFNRDGIWIGGAYTRINHEWRAKPYKSKNSFAIITAPIRQGAYRIDYDGHFPNAIGRMDLKPEASIDFPINRNFFGFGNDVPNLADGNNFNWIRMERIELRPLIALKHNKHLHFNVGPYFHTFDISEPDPEDDRFIVDFSEEIGYDPFERQSFLGGDANLTISFVDRLNKPTNGFNIKLNAIYLNQLGGEVDLFRGTVQWTCYFPLLKKPEVVLANNLWYSYSRSTFGPELFDLLPSLGNSTGLRGFRNNRFIGDQSLAENVDLRIKLLESKNGILPFDLGVLGGYDVGRVWFEGEESNTWHQSTTVGIWFDFLGALIIQPYYSFTKERNTASLLARFNF